MFVLGDSVHRFSARVVSRAVRHDILHFHARVLATLRFKPGLVEPAVLSAATFCTFVREFSPPFDSSLAWLNLRRIGSFWSCRGSCGRED